MCIQNGNAGPNTTCQRKKCICGRDWLNALNFDIMDIQEDYILFPIILTDTVGYVTGFQSMAPGQT